MPKPAQYSSLYPFQSRFMSVDGVRMHYIDEGNGPPLVLCHGNPTWSFFFRHIITGLRDRFRVIAMDHIGCGLSDKPRDYSYTLAMHIRYLGRLIDQLKLKEFSLGGHDWGGAIAFGWATANPSRIQKLVVFNTAAFLVGRTPLRIRVCGWPIIGEITVRGLNLFSLAALRMAIVHRDRITPEIADRYLAPYDNYANRIGVLRFIRDIPNRPGVPSLTVLQTIEASLHRLNENPMIVFWGGQDFCFNDVFLAEWRRRFPNAEVHRFADAGHYVLEDAHERIVPLLREFMMRTS